MVGGEALGHAAQPLVVVEPEVAARIGVQEERAHAHRPQGGEQLAPQRAADAGPAHVGVDHEQFELRLRGGGHIAVFFEDAFAHEEPIFEHRDGRGAARIGEQQCARAQELLMRLREHGGLAHHAGERDAREVAFGRNRHVRPCALLQIVQGQVAGHKQRGRRTGERGPLWPYAVEARGHGVEVVPFHRPVAHGGCACGVCVC